MGGGGIFSTWNWALLFYPLTFHFLIYKLINIYDHFSQIKLFPHLKPVFCQSPFHLLNPLRPYSTYHFFYSTSPCQSAVPVPVPINMLSSSPLYPTLNPDLPLTPLPYIPIISQLILNLLCSVSKLCPTLCDLMDCSTPGSSVLLHLPKFAQIHVHWVSDAS